MRPPELTPLATAVLHVAGTPERVLAVGCGEGDGALVLAREYPTARVRGVDAAPEAVRRASSRVGLDPEGRVAFKVGTAAGLPFPDDHFDLVAFLDLRPSPAESARVLRGGGHLVAAACRPAGGLLSWRPSRSARPLARRGFTPLAVERAGDGSFLVARLDRA
jgi:ubiquinone/menaquinone biosynthesis C-methylase UbiE